MSTLVVNVDEGSCANSSNENSMEHSTDSPAVTSLTPNSNPTSHLNSSSIDRDDPIQYECENHAENTTAATNCNSSYAASRDDDNKHVTVDRYGFIVDTEGENRNSFHQKLAMSKKINEERKMKETERERKWIKMLSNWEAYANPHVSANIVENSTSNKTNNTGNSNSSAGTNKTRGRVPLLHTTMKQRGLKLKRRIRKGIPDSVRSKVWCYFLNCEAMKVKYGTPPPTAEQCETLNSLVLEDIDKDIDRTFPYHIMFRDANADGQNDLRRLLQGYAFIDRETSYCQGMSFVAAFLLSYLEPNDAFYCFTSLMNDHPIYPVKVLYTPDMYEIQCILYVFGQLCLKYIPKLYAHLLKEHMDPSMYATEWFMTLYTRGFSFELVTRIFDIFITEGDKVLYRVAIALLINVEKELLACGFEEIMGILRNIPCKVDAEHVLNIAFSLPIKTFYIEKFKSEYTDVHAQKLAERQANRERREG